jgi:hypothetical protein
VIEVWQSVEAHRHAAKDIPREAMGKAMSMLAGQPTGAYFLG